MRPNWGSYFMLLAKLAASRSTCNSRPVGCILVKDNQVLSTGYNGPPPQSKHCTDLGGKGFCLRRKIGASNENKQDVCVASHAEINALAMAAKKGISVEGATLYITLNPCMICLKALRVAGISAIKYEMKYDLNTVDDYDGMVRSMGFNYCFEQGVSEKDIAYVKSFLDSPTSYRRILE